MLSSRMLNGNNEFSRMYNPVYMTQKTCTVEIFGNAYFENEYPSTDSISYMDGTAINSTQYFRLT